MRDYMKFAFEHYDLVTYNGNPYRVSERIMKDRKRVYGLIPIGHAVNADGHVPESELQFKSKWCKARSLDNLET